MKTLTYLSFAFVMMTATSNLVVEKLYETKVPKSTVIDLRKKKRR